MTNYREAAAIKTMATLFVLAMLVVALSPARVCAEFNCGWDPDTAVHPIMCVGGCGIVSPANGSSYQVSSSVACSAHTEHSAYDYDRAYCPGGQTTYSPSAIDYLWTAKDSGGADIGSWVDNDNHSKEVTWQAPNSPISNVTIQCVISDDLELPSGGVGSRDDPDLTYSVIVNVYSTGHVTYSYDDAHGVTTVVYANGTSCRYMYDERQRVRQVKNMTSSGTGIASAVLNYTVDGASNRTDIWFDEDEAKASSFTYDALSRLNTASYYNASTYGFTNETNSFGYDWVGNIYAVASSPWIYDDTDKLLQRTNPTATYSYSSPTTGSLQSGGSPSRTYTYDDPRDLLSRVGGY